MTILQQGGWVMWPLLAVSVIAVAVIAERCLFFCSCRFPGGDFDRRLQETLRSGTVEPLTEALDGIAFLQAYAAILRDADHPHKDSALRLAGTAVIVALERNLSLLGLLARIAPLLGLLGTILGMITTFSRIASAQSGVDMNMLAQGIWQALLTTATGLIIAIPVVFCQHLFQSRVRRVASALADAGNAALTIGAEKADA